MRRDLRGNRSGYRLASLWRAVASGAGWGMVIAGMTALIPPVPLGLCLDGIELAERVRWTGVLAWLIPVILILPWVEGVAYALAPSVVAGCCLEAAWNVWTASRPRKVWQGILLGALIGGAVAAAVAYGRYGVSIVRMLRGRVGYAAVLCAWDVGIFCLLGWWTANSRKPL